ncbi:diguanylate cyclase [Chloroflexota bacterium]
MNSYALFPLFAIVAYIPLLVTTVSSRPLQRKHILFALFLTVAILWSLSDVILRSDFLRQHDLLLGKLIIIMFTWMAVQFHIFASSFFYPGQGRWLPFAYGLLAMTIVLAAMGYVPEAIVVSGSRLSPEYGKWIVLIMVPLLTLAARDSYVFRKMLKAVDNPVIYNQLLSLQLAIFVLVTFGLVSQLPWGREYAVTHFGSIINAFILSYATIRHQLVDIRIVLRRGLSWVVLGIIAAGSYGSLLFILHALFRFKLDLTAGSAAILISTLITIAIYKLHNFLLVTMGKAFQGQSYDYRQKLSDFATRIHNVFSLKQQGGELLTLVTKAIGCKRAGLMFFNTDSEDFTTQLVEPQGDDNTFSLLRMEEDNPIVKYLKREHKPLTRENVATGYEFRSLWEREREVIESSEIEILMPLISRDSLIGMLLLGKKQAGRYTLEDLTLLEDVTDRVAVSMEKEYLREQLKEREEELSIINRSSTIITSSLDIQTIYDSFIQELKKVVEVSWAAIVLIDDGKAHFLALSSEIGSPWQVGERIPIKGTATEWMVAHRKAIVEADLSQASRFATGKYHLKQGVRSVVYVPLIAKGEVIGSLIVASRHPDAYSQRQVKLLEQLSSQIAMPIENSRLYAKSEQLARVDELTGLLNRRSLDEQIRSEIGRHSRYGGIFSIIILDLDFFKAFNDNYGHLAGDKLLKQISGIMENTIRSTDRAFRYGGDEFAVLLPQTAIEAAYTVAERIRQQVISKAKAGHIAVTISLGLAAWPADGIRTDQIMATADTALYLAKRSGGNRSCCASGTLMPPGDSTVKLGDIEDSKTLRSIFDLAATVDARNHYTQSHSQKVEEYAIALAEALNVEPQEIDRLRTCALLHDIGKIGISDKILNKHGKLTAQDWEAIKTHPQQGAAIAGHFHQLASCIPGILHHHEKYDGSGYPKGLTGEAIPLESRILAIADAFAAMNSDRPYSDALSYEEALEEIKRGAGSQFDPALVEAFLSMVHKLVPTLPQTKTGGGK